MFDSIVLTEEDKEALRKLFDRMRDLEQEVLVLREKEEKQEAEEQRAHRTMWD
jgi:hypothetical protein